jgi:hypothetical protein
VYGTEDTCQLFLVRRPLFQFEDFRIQAVQILVTLQEKLP